MSEMAHSTKTTEENADRPGKCSASVALQSSLRVPKSDSRVTTFERVEDYTKVESNQVYTCERTGAKCCCTNYF